ncbi:uncharacterized protein LOC132759009 [Ruditapes philippinarum]|uniref:uncharacterized protein LOC132759009 n=1 Tax=Ruditapes philippinarum TaxID=129788 RepID=UPI00295BE63A|nr:uncharacterized protein LOC132759009 [Ruditapes philippinarum]
MKVLDVSSIQDIPGYVEILKFVLKTQIQNLVEQLQDHAGEETLVLSANLTAGTLSHLESERGQGFLDMRDDIKSQFLTHCLQGKQKYHTAEPPGQRTACQRVIVPPNVDLKGDRVMAEQLSESLKSTTTEREPACTTMSHDGSTILSQSERFEFIHAGTSKLTEIGDFGKLSTRSTQAESSRPFEKNALKLSESRSVVFPQLNSTLLTQSSGTGYHLFNKKLFVDNISGEPTSDTHNLLLPGNQADTHNLLLLGNQAETHRLLLPSNQGQPQQTISNSLTNQTDNFKDAPVMTNIQQHDKVDCIPRQNSNKMMSPLNTLLSGQPVTNLPFVAHSVSGQFTNLPTINQSAVKDILNFPMNTPVVPQFLSNLQSNISPVKVTDKNPSVTSSAKLEQTTSLLCPDTLYNLFGNLKSSPVKTVPVSSVHVPNQENITGFKVNADFNLLQDNTQVSTNCSQNANLKQSSISTANEVVCKTTKRKQKRSTGPKLQTENTILQDTPVKKVRVLSPEFSANQTIVTMHQMTSSCQSKDISNSPSVTSMITNFSTPNVSNTAGFSLLKMPPVVLIDDPNHGKRKIFLESGSLNTADSCSKSLDHSKSLLDESNGQSVHSVSSVTKHALDGKEKDKTKKTLSSKIDEITQRITKDDAIKQHTVQTSDCDHDNNMTTCSNNSRTTPAGYHSNNDSLNNDSPNVSTPPSVEHLHDGDPTKLKDGSRASHRKPKLPRYNIGVASDDEDNSEVIKPPCISSPETPIKSHISQFPISPSAVNIGHDEAQDIISIQVAGEDSETSFPHINLEELADGLLLTDLPIVSYYNNVEDSSKSLIESVFNLKPGRDPNTKKPLNSQSVIVSGSKLEKDWVKCPLCPDKFLTVEALQYHIKNVNHVAKRYECDLCKRKFSQLRDMERHRRIHTGERPFTCDVCNKSFSRKDNLKSHARKHTLK